MSLLERGRLNVTISTLRQIAAELRITLSKLFDGLG
jgi:transcriptional regulator with XRE-family HTH domain